MAIHPGTVPGKGTVCRPTDVPGMPDYHSMSSAHHNIQVKSYNAHRPQQIPRLGNPVTTEELNPGGATTEV